MGMSGFIQTAISVGSALLTPAADAEQTSVAFTGLLGSAQKATVFLKDLRDFANKTPFEFPELAQDAREMLGFGFATKDVIPMMTRLGDAVATMGGSSDDIDRAVTAIGQMHAKTKVTADEMNQLTELGIPAWDLLAKSMGKTTAQVAWMRKVRRLRGYSQQSRTGLKVP
jgi:tape measure domain-containing protein